MKGYDIDPTIAEVREVVNMTRGPILQKSIDARIAVALLYRLEDEEQTNDRHSDTCCHSEYCDCDCGFMQRFEDRRERREKRQQAWRR